MKELNCIKMVNKLITFILLILLTVNAFPQSNVLCNCSSTSDDKIEKLIALASKGDTKAQSFYITDIEGKVRIDPDLEKSVRIPIFHNWEQVKELENRIAYLKNPNKKGFLFFKGKLKSAEEYDSVYWIKFNRLNCFEEMVAKLKKIDEYIIWVSSNKKEKQAIKQRYYDTVIHNSLVKEQLPPLPLKKDVPLEPYKHQTILPPIIPRNDDSATIAAEIIYFKENEISLDNEDIKVLDSICKYIKGHLDVYIDLQGFASSTGSRGDNTSISKSRCYSVIKWFETNRCCVNKITDEAYGVTVDKNLRAVLIRVLTK